MEESYLLVMIAGWIAWTVLNYMVAKAKGMDTAPVIFASMLLTPLLVYLYIAAVPPHRTLAQLQAGGQPDYLQGR